LTIGLFIYFSDKKTRENLRNKIKNNLIFNYIIYLFLLTALFFTFSRSAWLALILSSIVLLFLFFAGKEKSSFKTLFKLLLFSFVLILIIAVPYKNLVKARFLGGTSLEIKSTQERIASMEQSEKIIKNNLFFGTGIGNYTLVLKEYYEEEKYWPYQPVHNTFLLIFSEIGLLGFLFFIAMFFYLIYKSFKYNFFVNLSLLISLFVFMFFDHWLWSLHFGVLFFWVVLALVYRDIHSFNN
jgi:O-antigen ligase